MAKLTVSVVAAVAGDVHNEPCLIYKTYRKGLKVVVETWCNKEKNAADGVFQLPSTREFCGGCTSAIDKAKNHAP